MASNQQTGPDRNVLIVAATALVTSLGMVLVGFRGQGLVANAGDPYQYGKIAHHFVEHGFDEVTRRAASLYPTFLSVIYGFGAGDLVVQLIQCALFAGTCSLVYFIGRHLFNPRTGLIAGVFCAFHPMFLRYVADLHMETWLTFFSMLTVWRSIRFYDRPSVRNGVLLGVVGTIATLSKGVVLPFMVATFVIWVVRGLRRAPGAPNPLPGILAMGITMAVMIAPWTYRNYRVSGHVVMLTPGTPDAFLRGYIFTRMEFITLKLPPYTYAENESNTLFRRIAKENGTTWEKDEVVDDINNNKEMKRMIKEHPLLTVRKVVVGLFTFWYEMTNLKNSLVPLALAILNWTLASFGFKRALAEKRPFWLLLVPIASLNLIVAVLVPLGRYSTPILPCLAVLAAFGVDTLLSRLALKGAASPQASA